MMKLIECVVACHLELSYYYCLYYSSLLFLPRVEGVMSAKYINNMTSYGNWCMVSVVNLWFKFKVKLKFKEKFEYV